MLDMEAAAIQPLMSLSVETRLVRKIPGLPTGDRGVFDIVKGRFEGPRLRGEVLATGGDWTTHAASVSRMEVRMLLQTHDGVTIPFRYSGCASQSDGRARIEIAGYFEAPAGAYAWLNAVQAFGRGQSGDNAVHYQLYCFQ